MPTMTLNSSDQLFESLSAMVDNEASELEMRRVLRNMEGSPEILERWRRYHLIGSVMRKEHSFGVSSPGSLVSSISNSLNKEAESTPSDQAAKPSATSASDTAPSPKFLREMMGKTAIAASFAATLVLGFNYMGTSREGVSTSEATIVGLSAGQPSGQSSSPQFQAVAHAPVGFELPLPEARTVSMGAALLGGEPRSSSAVYVDDITDYATQEMLNRLLIQHAERASAHGSLGIMPFARVHKMQADFPSK
jgi:sigma-E factor negative regulatory protein RseA